MEILLTNDDGIYAEGIKALYDSLRTLGNVTVVAPDTERSAVGHGITLSDPLRVNEVFRGDEFFGYSTSGTPADCVKLAVRALVKKRPDIVVSGINHGPNVGYSVLYSGTVSGATEGAIIGIPSLAISLGTFGPADFDFSAGFARKVVELVIAKGGLPEGTFLNINVPPVKPEKIKGIKIVKHSRKSIEERFDKRRDPHQKVYYWLTGEVIKSDGHDDADIEELSKQYVTVTPISCDMTDYGFLEELEGWGFGV